MKKMKCKRKSSSGSIQSILPLLARWWLLREVTFLSPGWSCGFASIGQQFDTVIASRGSDSSGVECVIMVRCYPNSHRTQVWPFCWKETLKNPNPEPLFILSRITVSTQP